MTEVAGPVFLHNRKTTDVLLIQNAYFASSDLSFMPKVPSEVPEVIAGDTVYDNQNMSG